MLGSRVNPSLSHELDPRLALVHRFFSGTGSTYDRIVHWATLGIDARWKRVIIQRIPSDARRVVDLACGTGILTLGIARQFPQCMIVGVELHEEYLALARQKVKATGLRNVELVLSRAEDYEAAGVDCVVSSYLAKYADLPLLVRRSRESLREGGLLIMHDFILPPPRTLLLIWRAYFWLLQRVGTRLYPAWRPIFHGLPQLIERTRWLPELSTALEAADFRDIRVDYLTLYGSAIVTATKGAS